MKELSKSYLIDNKYIIINYTSSKSITYEKEKRIDKILNNKYYNFSLENIILIIRSILGNEKENTFRITIVYHDDITDLVYFSKGRIVKYAKKIENNKDSLDILYTVKKGLNIKVNNKNSELIKIIPTETNNMNNLENIKEVSLKRNDLLLYEIYKLFYHNIPNFLDCNDRIKTQIMMFILDEYGIKIEEDIFSLTDAYPKNIKINESMNRLMLANSIPEVKIRDYYKKDIIVIGKVLSKCNIDELIEFARYMYIKKYRDKNYIEDKSYRLVKKIDRSMEVTK